MKTLFKIILLFVFIICTSHAMAQKKTEAIRNQSVKFVSFPDFFNFDIPEPWPQYDTAVNYFLGRVKDEKPDFVLVDGDLVDGHWWNSPKCIEHMGSVYYSAWVRRMQQHGLKFYTAVGDHELGDDPWPADKRKLIPAFEKAYNETLKMPQNGPANKKGLAYFVRQGPLLLVTIETFEIIGDSMYNAVAGEQLEWFRKVLADNRDARFRIVQGHVGLWGKLRARSSSFLMLNGGKESEFYKVMKENGVDAYLAGEFHDVTILESDGIWQIVHGSSWGRKMIPTEDYLVGEVKGNVLNLTMKRIYMDALGENMWNLNKDNGPAEIVRINEKTLKNGPETTGTLSITNSNGKKTCSNRTGFFAE
jgi:hypothetical protein